MYIQIVPKPLTHTKKLDYENTKIAHSVLTYTHLENICTFLLHFVMFIYKITDICHKICGKFFKIIY